MAGTHATPKGLLRSGYVLGFALSGFFDGILLHQILQWHHLLSGVDALATNLPLQIAADGYFHAVMYLIAALGLAMLWRNRTAWAVPGVGIRYARALLIGFAAWHVTDAVLAHWLLGIHRIRMVPDPLFWDLAWLGLFGLVPLLFALMLRRSPRTPRNATAMSLLLTVMVGGAALSAARPPADAALTTIVFRSGTEPADRFAQLAKLDARIAWSDASGRVIVAELPSRAAHWSLYRNGAIFVSGSGSASCADWLRT